MPQVAPAALFPRARSEAGWLGLKRALRGSSRLWDLGFRGLSGLSISPFVLGS